MIPWNRRSSKDQNNVKADIDMGKRINPERIWKKEQCKVMIWNKSFSAFSACWLHKCLNCVSLGFFICSKQQQ